MDEHTCVVVACSHMEDRTSLIHVLEGLSLDVISCSDMDQVREVLSGRNVPLLFCDQHLSEVCSSRPRFRRYSQPEGVACRRHDAHRRVERIPPSDAIRSV